MAESGRRKPATKAATKAAPALTLSAGQSVEAGDGITLAFATPILRLALPGAEFLNKGLARRILESERKDKGRVVSNRGGWQSDGNIFDWELPELRVLAQAIELGHASLRRTLTADRRAPGGALRLDGWANVNRDGDWNRTHSHAGAHWSGVYYVDAGQPDPTVQPNGVLELIDPRHLGGAVPAPGFPLGHRLVVEPEPGLLVMFPSWLEHWVTPYRGKGQRISVAFNAVANAPA